MAPFIDAGMGTPLIALELVFPDPDLAEGIALVDGSTEHEQVPVKVGMWVCGQVRMAATGLSGWSEYFPS